MAAATKAPATATKRQRDAAQAALWNIAQQAGAEAVKQARPAPMIVQQRANPLDDNSAIIHEYEPIADGICGFGWVTITPATTAFARYLKREGIGRKGYYGGLEIRAPGGTTRQSYELKQAWAGAAAAKLREAGITAYAEGRLD